MGRVYLGRDENGKQLFEWVGRFDSREERDEAVRARRRELATIPRMPDPKPGDKPYIGWMYAIQAGSAKGPIKLGIARDPYLRLSSLQTACWEELRLIGAWRIESTAAEARIHLRFRRSRIRGEWFRATKGLLELVEELDHLHFDDEEAAA